ncbi:MAG: hypothetical protein JXA64_00915 [Candidatus Fermentibacteraceae bacterium]|nr:hypothetical protein [Candidatus Fermentibacteraceae bacterium]MBN2607647.1 hypothetical protein [Candidatus Fermentibacteraceae bacterium]
MDEGRLVDLLLVRLSRDDEKQKVIDLLVSELGMTQEQATEKVEKSPSILRENVEMEQGRILQDRMYPFVDLLPKYYKSGTEPSTQTAPDSPATEEAVPSPPEDDSIQHGFDDIGVKGADQDIDQDEDMSDIIHNQSAITEDEYKVSYDDAEDESLIITSAAEDVINVDRCHICGRTPTKDEKLVPCTTCGELTCVRCYNRKEHVCEKCAAMGRTVDRPLDAPPEMESPARPEPEHFSTSRRPPARKSASVRSGSFFGISPVILAVSVLVVLAIAFVLLDPLNMLGKDEGEDGSTAFVPDTVDVHPQDTVATGPVEVPDSSIVAVVDSGVVAQDSMMTDTLDTPPAISLRDISLPDSLLIPDGFPVPRAVTDLRIQGIEVQSESLQFIATPLGQLSALYSIELDGYSLIRTESGHDILLMSILHPEPAEKRAAMIGMLGSLLDSTMIDQMVLYYQENQYYEPDMFSFTADSFSALALSTSPYFLQRKQAMIPETSELVTGLIFQRMTDLD